MPLTEPSIYAPPSAEVNPLRRPVRLISGLSKRLEAEYSFSSMRCISISGRISLLISSEPDFFIAFVTAEHMKKPMTAAISPAVKP